MRIVIVTQDDPLVTAEFFRVFLPRVEPPHEVVAVIGLPGFSESTAARIRRFSRLYGFFGAVKLAWRYLAAKLRGGGVAKLCRRHGTDFVAFGGSVKSADFRELVGSLEPDLLVSVSSPQVFGPRLLAIPRLGAVNLHGAPLPKYAGMLPSFWQLLHGEKQGAVTLHYMSEEVDKGQVITQQFFDLPVGITQFELMRLAKRVGAETLLGQLDAIASGTVEARPMRQEGASYFGFPTSEDVRRFRKLGKKLI